MYEYKFSNISILQTGVFNVYSNVQHLLRTAPSYVCRIIALIIYNVLQLICAGVGSEVGRNTDQ